MLKTNTTNCRKLQQRMGTFAWQVAMLKVKALTTQIYEKCQLRSRQKLDKLLVPGTEIFGDWCEHMEAVQHAASILNDMRLHKWKWCALRQELHEYVLLSGGPWSSMDGSSIMFKRPATVAGRIVNRRCEMQFAAGYTDGWKEDSEEQSFWGLQGFHQRRVDDFWFSEFPPLTIQTFRMKYKIAELRAYKTWCESYPFWIILWQVKAVPTMVASYNLKLPILEDAWRPVLPSMPPLPQIGGPCW